MKCDVLYCWTVQGYQPFRYRLLHKVRNSLLLWSVTYFTVGRYRDTNRSDAVYYMRLRTAFYSEVWRTVGRQKGRGLTIVHNILLYESRNSLLLWSVTYCTVGRYRDTNRSDRVCYMRLGTACYSQVWGTVGRYRDNKRSGTVRYIRLGSACYSEVWRTVLWDGTRMLNI